VWEEWRSVKYFDTTLGTMAVKFNVGLAGSCCVAVAITADTSIWDWGMGGCERHLLWEQWVWWAHHTI